MDRAVGSDPLFASLGGSGLEAGDNVLAQSIPVNVYETDQDVVVIAPMPGVEAENIDVEVQGNTITLRASIRGVGQTARRYLVHEWTYGPYERTLTLPIDIDAEHANASHSNGILTLSFPKGPRSRAVQIPLQQVGAAQSRHQGHSGHHTTREGLPGGEPPPE